MTALMIVLMVPVGVGMLVNVSAVFVLMLMPIMAVGTTFVAMLVFMLVLVVATHLRLTSWLFFWF
jgi:hypothetical protein